MTLSIGAAEQSFEVWPADAGRACRHVVVGVAARSL